jgi:hypothetical protein
VEHTPTEVATSDSSLGSPDRQVFMTTNETPRPLGTLPDQYLKDISANELSTNAPANKSDANRDARREHNRKRNKRRQCLRKSLPIRNLAEALNQVENRVPAMPDVYHHDSTSGSGDARGRSHRQARRGCLLHES